MANKIKLSIFKKALKKDLNLIKIMFVFIMFSMIIISFYGTNNFFKNQSEQLKSSFKIKDSFLEKTLYSIKSETKESIQLKEQFEIISNIKEPYLVTAEKYSSFNYTFSIFFTIFSILSGILGFIILQNGWSNLKNFYLKASFLISFFCSTLFGVLPNVLGNEENIKNNLSKYNFYNGLQLDIYSLISDNKGYLKRNTPNSIDSLNREILSITKNIKENQDLYFNVYIDQVPKEIKPFE